MILERLTFEYDDKILIEKVKIGTPFRYEAIFENSGCFIYFKDRAPKLLSAEQNVQVNSQEAVLLKCGNHFLDMLKQTNDEEVEVMVVHLYPEVLKKIYSNELPKIIQQGDCNIQSKVVVSKEVISRFIESLEFYFQNPVLINNDLLELKIKELVLLLIQSENVCSIQELISDLYSTRSVHIKKVIELHHYSNLSLDELAKLCNLSLSSFKREFKKVFNDSPNNYITDQKLKRAKELLSITEMPVGEIAFGVGFNDPLYFTRIFKKKVGKSPTEYRLSPSN
ncbi:AraC family transcriptional regulator [Aquimarina sp. BL5]|uniref:helix-turn-helix domain-containing protein n=1 Tax=Aquimarina sp. BL5 TaxID=1714860 RepID=UPI000E481F70|nr:helix-turn-helix domain-containing protein [Aquimarina sp. BL5]AXT52570.1 AraC family transcriptional regulator [Aquimarina sp. BL5]RKN11244.1 helix-turn-helix domain-containing protein [Aquimarina sp. BL5]